MEVSLNKSYCLALSLMDQTLDLQLAYKGIQIPLCDKFKYLGMTQINMKTSALKRLAGERCAVVDTPYSKPVTRSFFHF
ncbi:hypothetical protein TNIN_421231 [Trichonephila inaurata madagascariensis]|uniref:Uncharacterized protein n=1 Tax=Trichonephila inaurata madagascariensis TaxID=2747483 RepID=A0A8X6YSK6_9ARAC|nr:hypothetical protein TNIN_421231 [Trichonephila inaurata madagascariensis]